MTERADLAVHIAELVGGGLLEISDPGSGWPAFGNLIVDDNPLPVALFVGAVGLSHRERDEVERRFQNPGQNRPIVLDGYRHPLLLGLLEPDQQLGISRPLLIQADPYRRVGRVTRFSVFESVIALQKGAATGWAEETSSSGELIRCFLPPLLPVSVAAVINDAAPSGEAMQAAIDGSGLIDSSPPEEPAAAERARRAGTTLVRDARFSRQVILAYDGFCAMCGLDANLVQGAHIYPASAPGSQDESWNGLALCPNHHLAFDRHLLAVDPDSRKIVFSPELLAQLQYSNAMSAFVTATFAQLAEPSLWSARPRSQMFVSRYRYFPGSYDWMNVLLSEKLMKGSYGRRWS
jgi:hypothetical protein